MSIATLYRPVNPAAPKVLSSSNHVQECIERAFGYPCRLSEKHIPVLQGMAAVCGEKKIEDNPYLELVEAINEFGIIEVFPE